MRVFRGNRWPVIGLAVVVLAVLIIVLASQDGEPEGITQVGQAPTTTQGVDLFGAANPADDENLAEVPPIDCRSLLENDEIDDALASPEIPDATPDFIRFTQGEVCDERVADDERFFVRLEPGHPDDFIPGSRLLGVPGETVEEVGEEALWFGGNGTDDGGDSGALSVREGTTFGMLYFRIVLGRPDLESAEQREVAKALGLQALPRFPGLEEVFGPEPLVDLCELVTDEEAEDLLAGYRDAHPATLDEVSVISNVSEPVDLRDSGDSACAKLILAEIYVETQQGIQTDFGAGAELGGVVGEPVLGLGEEAVWFADVPFQGPFTAPHPRGVLGIRQGEASFRIVLALPDTPSSEQLDIATHLATNALLRIPGFDAPASTDFAAAFDEPEIDPSGISYVDNLLVKEEAGEWTRGEGLVATLKLFVGEAAPVDVLRHSEVTFNEGTGIVAMANEYLEGGLNTEAQTEIARLLGLILFTSEELEAMAGIAPSSEPDASEASVTSGVLLARAFVNPDAFTRAADVQITAQESVESCQRYVHPDKHPFVYGVGPCLEWKEADLEGNLKGKYRIFIPAPSLPQEGWTEDHYELALTALKESATWFEGEGLRVARAAGALGKMPAVNVVFSIYSGGENLAIATPESGRACGVVLFPWMQALHKTDPGDFKQIIAHELAHCFDFENFPSAGAYRYSVIRWREEGLAAHLSNRVYPETNQEWDYLGDTDRLNRSTTLFDLAFGNFLFFQFLDKEIGLEGVFKVVISLGSGSRSDQEKRLAAYPDMKSQFHEYVETMIDKNIQDSGGGLVGKPVYGIKYETVVIDRTVSTSGAINPFGLGRLKLVVVDCKIARFGNDFGEAEDSVRPTAERVWTRFPANIPQGSADARDRIYVLTASEDTTVTLAVTDLDDDPDCEEKPCDLGPCGPSRYYHKDS